MRMQEDDKKEREKTRTPIFHSLVRFFFGTQQQLLILDFDSQNNIHPIAKISYGMLLKSTLSFYFTLFSNACDCSYIQYKNTRATSTECVYLLRYNCTWSEKKVRELQLV